LARRCPVIRVRALVVLALLWSTAASAQDARLGRVFDLDRPGALEALRLSNPTHYSKVRQILEGVFLHSDAEVPRWMQTNFQAQDVQYGPIVLTSHPPKRRLSFALDAMRYEGTVILTNVRGEIVPAK
jgi:hypothetical protein